MVSSAPPAGQTCPPPTNQQRHRPFHGVQHRGVARTLDEIQPAAKCAWRIGDQRSRVFDFIGQTFGLGLERVQLDELVLSWEALQLGKFCAAVQQRLLQFETLRTSGSRSASTRRGGGRLAVAFAGRRTRCSARLRAPARTHERERNQQCGEKPRHWAAENSFQEAHLMATTGSVRKRAVFRCDKSSRLPAPLRQSPAC